MINNRLTYDLQSVKQNKIIANAHELLKELPSISSTDGNSLNLAGANGTTILISGKVSSLSTEQLIEYLKTLPAEKVEKVEVIYNAPPQLHIKGAVINVVLNQKYRLAKSKGITVSFQINDLSGAWMEEQDMVILLANLLDNAIEACENRKDDPVIRLKLLRENSQILLSVQNPVESTQDMIHDQLSTSKADKANHGIGLKNVQMVLEKYDGMSRIHSEDGWFYFTAMIPDEK